MDLREYRKMYDQIIPLEGADQRILNGVSVNKMKKINMYKVVMAAVALIVVLSTAGTAYAAWKYWGPEKIALEQENYSLADAFASKDAVVINKSVSSHGFQITLLGMVSGKNLSRYRTEIDGEILDDQTYCAVAIELPDKNDETEFCISPFIQGQNPDKINIAYMAGSVSTCHEGNICYYMVDCKNLEMFAAQGVYLGVMDQLLGDEMYSVEEKTGDIVANKDYDGVNVLFKLPFDKKKGNDELAQRQLETWKEEHTYAETNVDRYFKDWTAKDVIKKCMLLPNTTNRVAVDKDGNFTFPAVASNNRMNAAEENYNVSKVFGKRNVEAGTSAICDMVTGEGLTDTFFWVATVKSKDTVETRVYQSAVWGKDVKK